MRLLFASTNRGKRAELEALLAPAGIQVISPAELAAPLPEVDEDQETFAGNAEKKARSAHRATGLAALADDSGLEVDALGGAPGVRSARYAGEGAGDRANLEKLLVALAGVPDPRRTARFRCALALVDERGELLRADGVCEGRIALSPRGENGFGYDPVFLVADATQTSGAPFEGRARTMAELSREEKNAISHRAHAFVALARRLGARG